MNINVTAFRRLQRAGFALSAVLIVIFVAYGLSPRWQPNVLATFSPPAGFVNYPTLLRYSLAIFFILNPLGYLLDGLVAAFGQRNVWSPSAVALTWLLAEAFQTLAWWWMLGKLILLAGRWAQPKAKVDTVM